MSDVKTYNPKEVIITWNGIPLSGFADGTFAAFVRYVDAFEKHVGSDGAVSRAKSADRSGHATVTLAQTSPSNDLLSVSATADELTGRGVGVLGCTDLSGRTKLMGALAWIKKVPKAEFGKSIANREWVFDIAEYQVFNGGSRGILG